MCLNRHALELLVPSIRFGATVRPATFPPHVSSILRRFAPSAFQEGCVPLTLEIKRLLDTSFRHEIFPPYAYRDVSTEDHSSARPFVDFAIRIHNTCTRNSTKSLDDTAWHPCVRSLLSIVPSDSPSGIPHLPPPEAHDPTPAELFLTIDSTTKTTRKSILHNYPNIVLDQLLVFNPEHVLLYPTAMAARPRILVINAFADSSIDDVLVALGVVVKCHEGPLAAQFQIGVWAAKTLTLASNLSSAPEDVPTAACDVAIAISVCGHMWSMYVTYWSAAGALLTHGPVLLGSTDSLYGTFKIIAWVVKFKEWAAETLLPDWVDRVAGG